jgi:hypothetical protein
MSLAEDVKLSACGRHPSLFFLSFCFILFFLIAINLLMFVLVRKDCC